MDKEQDTSHGGTPLPNWYQLYFAAVMEADESKALQQIGRACRAIEDRMIELRCNPLDNPHEIQDLNCALTYLKLLLQNLDAEGAAPECPRDWPPRAASL